MVEAYKNSAAFKEYVDRFMTKHHIQLDVALESAIVREVYKMYKEKNIC